MNRKDFLKFLALIPIGASNMNLKALSKISKEFEATPKMPILFLGHGSPMNAIEENEFVEGFRNITSEIPTPNAILCISAHWETNGTFVTAMEQPKTIHDFGGFPQELFEVQYPAKGSPELAKEITNITQKTQIELDHSWGLDHGTWSVVKHLYPKANIPVLQLSIDRTKNPNYHYELANELNSLRHKGVLIIGSGNIVHNLRMVEWRKLNERFGFDWAIQTNEKIKEYVLDGNHKDLIDYKNQGKEFLLSIPTPEHYIPLLYILGLKSKSDQIKIFNDKAVAGSLTMTSFKFW